MLLQQVRGGHIRAHPKLHTDRAGVRPGGAALRQAAGTEAKSQIPYCLEGLRRARVMASPRRSQRGGGVEFVQLCTRVVELSSCVDEQASGRRSSGRARTRDLRAQSARRSDEATALDKEGPNPPEYHTLLIQRTKKLPVEQRRPHLASLVKHFNAIFALVELARKGSSPTRLDVRLSLTTHARLVHFSVLHIRWRQGDTLQARLGPRTGPTAWLPSGDLRRAGHGIELPAQADEHREELICHHTSAHSSSRLWPAVRH
mmetsp:Transcript_13439/g.35857  ORF Transcript_13439/g.35857 Transcript_13439/m.35857 type:complete len:259 (+) Transcript_13439:439-1215(+)